MIFETFRQAIQNVWSNKLRTFLTMLGIIIGVMAVIVIVGLGNGMTKSMRDSFSALGTNTLTTLGASDRFLAYYGQMLDELRQTLGDDCIIYVQSIPPVRPAAAEKKPGLASDVLRGVNEQLAQLAASKGCVYLDLWEALADGEGNLKEMIAAPDGVHLSAGNGYGAWVTYLRNHAKYSASNPWIMGSAYSAE